MRAIILAKSSSTRVPNKNYRPFYGDLSLVDILARKLAKVFAGEYVFLSCEDPAKQSVADRWGIQFLQRDPALCNNAVPFPDLVRGIVGQIPGDDDVMWTEPIDPLFDQHAKMISIWREQRKHGFDSMTLCYPFREYTLDSQHRPEGFLFGDGHIPSQELPLRFRLNFACAILTRASIRRVGYPVGYNPLWYHAAGPCVDIDTPEDFEVAQLIYGHKQGMAE